MRNGKGYSYAKVMHVLFQLACYSERQKKELEARYWKGSVGRHFSTGLVFSFYEAIANRNRSYFNRFIPIYSLRQCIIDPGQFQYQDSASSPCP